MKRRQTNTLLVALLLTLFSGCRCLHKDTWREPIIATPQKSASVEELQVGTALFPLEQEAESSYARAAEMSEKGTPDSVTAAYWSALAAKQWHAGVSESSDADRAAFLYHSSLILLIQNAQRHDCWDAEKGLRIEAEAGPQWISVRHHGFAWQPADFNQLTVVGQYKVKEVRNVYARCGWGIPLVVERVRPCHDRFTYCRQRFAATVVLNGSNCDGDEATVSATGGVLEFYSPDRFESIQFGGKSVCLAADFSAPLALVAIEEPSQGIDEFFQVGTTEGKAQLIMTEPYQPDKIPVLMIHGLASDAVTWIPLANEIRGNAWYRDRYQIWAFRYPTGRAFLRAATTLRQELQAAVATLPSSADGDCGNLDKIVVVGHSMGGLVAKLQVTHSENRLWEVAANRPLHEIQTNEKTREELYRMFYFRPQPAISRVVFVATPHGGSSWARRSIGRSVSRLVTLPADDQQDHDQLVSDNPGTFASFLTKRIPTSVDLLEPNNPLLDAMRTLTVDSSVQLHSIIGTGLPMLCNGPADGVVPVTSARHPGVRSEIYVHEKHENVHKHPASMDAMLQILKLHWQEAQLGSRELELSQI